MREKVRLKRFLIAPLPHEEFRPVTLTFFDLLHAYCAVIRRRSRSQRRRPAR